MKGTFIQRSWQLSSCLRLLLKKTAWLCSLFILWTRCSFHRYPWLFYAAAQHSETTLKSLFQRMVLGNCILINKQSKKSLKLQLEKAEGQLSGLFHRQKRSICCSKPTTSLVWRNPKLPVLVLLHWRPDTDVDSAQHVVLIMQCRVCTSI